MIRRSLTLLLGTLAASLALAAPALAYTVYSHPLLSSFDGHDSDAGVFTPGGVGSIAINQSNGRIYVADTGKRVFSQFTPDGVAVNFPFSGAPYVPGSSIGVSVKDLAVDSASGRIYEVDGAGYASTFDSDGNRLWEGSNPFNFRYPPCGAAVDPEGDIWFTLRGIPTEFDFSGTPTGATVPPPDSSPGDINSDDVCRFAINTAPADAAHPTGGYFYEGESYPPGVTGNESIRAFASNPHSYPTPQYTVEPGPYTALAVDPSNGHIYVDHGDQISEYYPDPLYPGEQPGAVPGALAGSFGGPASGIPSGICGSSGIAIDATTHYVYVGDCAGRVDIFGPGVSYILPNVSTGTAQTTSTTATLHGSLDPDGGGDMTECRFQWGQSADYQTLEHGVAPCAEGNAFASDSGTSQVSAQLEGLTPGATYHYRLVGANDHGPSFGADSTFTVLGPPKVTDDVATEVGIDASQVEATIDPKGSVTTYHFEWGLSDCSTNVCANRVPRFDAELAHPQTTTEPHTVSVSIAGLSPDTTYHFRVVARNSLGTTNGPDRTLHTFDLNSSGADPCPNAGERQQSGAALLDDCRAYELVSAANAGGYDVQSDLVLGQQPLPAYPRATSRFLYALHLGTIPGIEGPTNHGPDPYIATRGEDGWSTTYVGIPVGATPSLAPFGSPLLGADRNLQTFAFGGQGLCAPCFADGSAGIPVHRSDGTLAQGMAGSLDPDPADPAGSIAAPLSANGRHLVFGSPAKFEPDANSGGEVTIYDRDLQSDTTQVVSKTPGGATMSDSGIAELAISADGSHILLGKQLATDAAGGPLYHLYINVGDSDRTIDLTPATTTGVRFAGMTDDGTKVFFTTAEKLTADDHDASADLYEAQLSGTGVALTRISTGDTDSCDPASSHSVVHWNSPSGAADCSVLAFADGAGVAAGDGSVYFLSPERLDTSDSENLPTQNDPNLYLSRPGQPPRFIATLSSGDTTVADALAGNGSAAHADLQVSPDGNYAVFVSARAFSAFQNRGHAEIYRYDAPNSSLICVSCAPSGVAASSDAELSRFGLNLTDDGRVFFTSSEPLVLRDTNVKPDAYEWSGGVAQLISTGTSRFASGLASVSADGTDAFFYTHSVLVPEDQNGSLVKIYDAREGGGYPFLPEPQPCRASDECHGPGSPAAPPASIQTGAQGGPTQAQTPKSKHCRRGRVKRHGHCVKPHRKLPHQKAHHQKHRHGGRK